MKKNYLINLIIGMGFGFPITLLCMTLMSGYSEVIQEFLVWMVASALYGLLSGVFFDLKSNLPLPVAIVAHCLGCMTITAGGVAICGYGSSFLSALLRILPVFAVIYVVVYIIAFFLMKNDEKQINQALEKN